MNGKSSTVQVAVVSEAASAEERSVCVHRPERSERAVECSVNIRSALGHSLCDELLDRQRRARLRLRLRP